ncbi:MAG: efflux RND transporter permease subunit, partial [Cyclobacteriaceae bacterium]
MWTKLAHIIIKFRLFLIILVGLVTIFMADQARKVELSYDLAKVVPSQDPDMLYFQQFKETFGEDGNILVIGVQDSSVYESLNFRRFKYMSDYIENIPGVTQVVALPNLQKPVKDTKEKKFTSEPLFQFIPDEQESLDILLIQAMDLKAYSQQLVNPDNGAMLMLVFIDRSVLHSKDRTKLTGDIISATEIYSEKTGIKLHVGGLPYMRSVLVTQVKDEMNMFLLLSALVTALILFIFFRSWNAVIFPMIVIGVMVVWTMGTLSLLGYKITLLTGLLPPIIVVIGIPNCIYLLNKYHQEYKKHGMKMLALSRVIRRIGIVTLITNFTTAVGFMVLAFTDIAILKEFGIVAGINIIATFLVSIVLIPVVFSYLPAPNQRQLKHLNLKILDRLLTGLDHLVHRQKYTVIVVSVIIVGVFSLGLTQLNTVSFMYDDVPKNSTLRQDLKFFEGNFKGIMPLEVVFDTGKKKGTTQLKTLRKIAAFEDFVAEHPQISRPVSAVSLLKGARQAFYNNKPKYYDLPSNQDRSFIYRYLRNQSDDLATLPGMVDSIAQQMRVSLKVADIGSDQMEVLVNETIQPKIDELFADTDVEAHITGTTLLFIKGNRFLIENLLTSLI